MVGKEIAYSKDTLKTLIGLDPDFFAELARRVQNVARHGELVDEKN